MTHQTENVGCVGVDLQCHSACPLFQMFSLSRSSSVDTVKSFSEIDHEQVEQ